MRKKHGLEFMMDFINDYLNGQNSRLDFELDFNHYFIEHYPKMERDNPELADCFAYYLSEEGHDKAYDLTDEEHKALIKNQLDEFLAAMRDGFL
ncbi:MAG: hypothetical protein LBD23_07560 [Oscillospiraceae bacterium]|jgi:cytosine/adenosine deaminase-related metal-dependent hydrolase|nr:hypothetical protein [Oscillospiraceae bacterium]